jgi:hypothetical protein
VIELLLHLSHARFARGNHDDVLDLVLHGTWLGGEDDAFEPAAAARWFMQHGMAETLISYGLPRADVQAIGGMDDDDVLQIIRQLIPEPHRQFIRDLPTVIDDGDALIAHAFWPPQEHNDPPHVRDRIAGDAEMRHRVFWERYQPGQIISNKPWSRRGYFGHTPVSNYPASMHSAGNVPIVGPKITLLDTAIALGNEGRLSAVCIEDGRLLQIDRQCKVVPG